MRRCVAYRVGVIALAGIAAIFAMGPFAADAAEPALTVPLALNFTWSVPHAPLRWGEAKGIFKGAGIDLDIVPTQGGDQSLQLLAAGKVDYAFADGDTFLTVAGAGKVAATAVYVWLDTPSLCVTSLAPLPDPQSMKGRSFGTTTFSTGRQLVPYILKQNGVDPATVRVDAVDFSVLFASFFKGEIDTVQINDPGSWQNLLVLAKKQGKTLYLARLSDWGLRGYDKLIIVRNDVLRSSPSDVARVVKAMNRAVIDAIASASDDEIYATMKDVMPQTDRAPMIADWHDFKAEAKTPGAVDPVVLADSVTRLVAAGIMPKPVAIDALYRNP